MGALLAEAVAERAAGVMKDDRIGLPIVSGGVHVARADLERRGVVIGPLDMLIAAHAAGLGITLVTNNSAEFRRVRGLHCENWA